MVNFYQKVFNTEFQERRQYGTRLYSGTWMGISLVLCPAAVANNTALQNRHQFDIRVPNLEVLVNKAIACGGERMGKMQQDDSGKRIGLYDPDGNSMVFIEIDE